MIVNERTLRNHHNLAPQYGELTRALCEGDDGPPWTLDLSRPDLPRFMSDFYYAVSTWPLLISGETRERFTSIVMRVPPLVFRVAHRYYGERRARFHARYGLPDLAYDRLLDPGETGNMLFRCDLVLVDDVPKLLEVNVGSRAGGWEVDWFWPQLARLVRSRPAWRHWTLSHINTLEEFCRFMLRAVRSHVGEEAPGTILVILAPYFVQYGFDQELAALHRRAMAGVPRPGKLLFDVDIDNVAVNADGRVEYRGEVIDAIMATSEHVTMPPELCDAHLRKQLFYPDNGLHMVATDKTHFAVLHLARAAGWLDSEDARLVDDHVPWSAFLTTDVVEWEGVKAPAPELALTDKDQWVLKRGLSCQGRDVSVGAFLSNEEWAAAIERAGTNGDWIIQRYCRPDRLYAPSGAAGIAEQDAVWGVFGLGREYGGTFGRLIEPDRGRGVVNAARGAKMSVVLEV